MVANNFFKFIKYYGKGKKLKLFGFFLLSLIAGGLEFLGIALIYPFILLIIAPQTLIGTSFYSKIMTNLNAPNILIATCILGTSVILIFIIKNLFIIATLYLQNKFICNWKLKLKKIFMSYYLFSSYKNSLETAPHEKNYNLTFLIDRTLDSFIFRTITLITNVTIIVMILSLLFMKFLIPAIITSLFVTITMITENKIFKAKVSKISKELATNTTKSNQTTLDTINNIKEIKILSSEKFFFNNYNVSQRDFCRTLFKNDFYATISPYIIEIFIVLALFILAGIISVEGIKNTSWIIASYGIIAACIFRMAPALNRIQSSINVINASRPFVKSMINLYETLDWNSLETSKGIEINFENKIRLENINFAYKKEPVIKDLSLEIRKGEFVGIIGLSGAGKSTIADIIMGLLPPDNGKIYIDELEINKTNFIDLRKLIGYVPQQINIIDGSLKDNIAYGIDEEIDEEQVIESLKKAQLYEYTKQLSDGINTNIMIGSAGMSQGQKQRLAIARAFYRKSKILIFDEATSALDVETEHEITQNLEKLRGETTIIAIAHRLSTLKSCDRLIYLSGGEIVDTGSFWELSDRHESFRHLLELSNIEK